MKKIYRIIQEWFLAAICLPGIWLGFLLYIIVRSFQAGYTIVGPRYIINFVTKKERLENENTETNG